MDMKTYFEENRGTNIQELIEFLEIPSISALSDHKQDMVNTAHWLYRSLENAGLENVKIMETNGHPVIYGEWLHQPNKPTVLIYGHYDVQPVDPIELWDHPPFEPFIKDDKIYARGATDDKGQVFMHIKAIEAYLKTHQKPPVNIKFCIEGEEEIGSPNLDRFIEQNRELLSADVLLISDTTLWDKNQPALCYGLKGLCAFQIDVKGSKADLHSGLYGGTVHNPIHALSLILSSIVGEDGRIKVEGFYDKVKPLTLLEKETFLKLGKNEEELSNELGVSSLFGEPNFSQIERNWSRPTLDINGIWGGFQGEGTKTVIPAEAHAKITCRLVNDQDPDEIMSLIEHHVNINTPKGVKVTFQRFDSGMPYIAPIDHPAIKAAERAYEFTYGVPPVFMRVGGSIPVVETFDRILNLPVVMMGFGLPGENHHSPNEHFHLENFDLGLLTIIKFFEELSSL
jgi:acetylornithine deacetylase/succinyl-diaminopimelate desuccinylase-like protein